LPSEKLVFHAGHLSSTDTAFHSEHLTQVETVVPEDCGCPPRVPVLRAQLPATPVPAENDISSGSLAPRSTVEAAPTQVSMPLNASSGTETALLSPLGHDEKAVEFEARLLFSPKDAPPPKLVNLRFPAAKFPFRTRMSHPLLYLKSPRRGPTKACLESLPDSFRGSFVS
jgi:hypothetical protein